MKATIYGRTEPFCVYCDKAKKLAAAKGVDYIFVSVPEDMSVDEFMAKFPGRKTVPQIVVDGNLLPDGFSSFAELIENTMGGFGDDFS